MLASQVELDQAGSREFADGHAQLFSEGFSFSGYERDGLWLNLGNKKYKNLSGVSGVSDIGDGRGAVMADFDNDGDVDIFLTRIQGNAHFLYRNNVGSDNRHLRVALTGTQSGTDAFGAVVRVKTTSGVLTKAKSGGAGYLSQHDPRLLFGLGQDASAEWVEVTWPSGAKQRVANVAAGASISITEGVDTPTAVAEVAASLPDPLAPDEAYLAKLSVSVGDRFPLEAVTNLKGESMPMTSAIPPGKKVLVNLWATYCVPCATEIPELVKNYPRLRKSDVEIVGLSLDAGGLDVVNRYVDKRKVNYPVFVADGSLIEKIYATSEVFIPLSFVLDERGVITEIHSGWSPKTKASIERLAELTAR